MPAVDTFNSYQFLRGGFAYSGEYVVCGFLAATLKTMRACLDFLFGVVFWQP